MSFWKLIFGNDLGRTEVYKGSAADRASAFREMLVQARSIHQARPDVREYPCQLGVDEDNRFVPHLFITQASSLLLPDEELIRQISTGMEERHALTNRYDREFKASGSAKSQPGEGTPSLYHRSFCAEWERLTAWLAEAVPGWDVELRPSIEGAWKSYSHTARVEWTPELIEFFSVQNGTRGLMITPLGPLFSLDEMQTLRNVMLGVWADQPDGDTGDAGTLQLRFIDEFVPIAGTPDCLIVVDLRPGEAHGSIGLYYGEAGLDSAPQWEDPAAFIASITTALEEGSSFLSSRPLIVDGQLEWPIDD
ncbi:hypothetical protein ABIE52_006980 [Rhodococcus sp. OAS809]|uniref:hypothetical protein n=1 Tax=Rhodococcus sp. OAS809 TaxID=2663874 RepID=UPI00178C0FD8